MTPRLKLELRARFWPYTEPFVLSRGAKAGEDSVQVRLTDTAGRNGRGEAVGVTYAGETPVRMIAAIEAVRGAVEAGLSRNHLLALLPHGGARMALDSALWDLDAKQGGPSPFEAAGLPPLPVTSVCSIGIKSLDGYAAAAPELAEYPVIKVKVDGRDPLVWLVAVHSAAPRAALVVDPNQSWSVDQTKMLAPLNNIPETDEQKIVIIIESMLKAVSWRPGNPPDLAAFGAAVLPWAAIVPSARPVAPTDIAAFRERMGGLHAQGATASFDERALSTVVHVFGNIAVALGGFETIVDNGPPGRGANAFLFVRNEGGWNIAGMAWDTERDGLILPEFVD